MVGQRARLLPRDVLVRRDDAVEPLRPGEPGQPARGRFLDAQLRGRRLRAVERYPEPLRRVHGHHRESQPSAATGCPTPAYQVWMLPPGGSWSVVRSYSTSADFAWNTSGWPAGNYRFSVWARDTSSLGTGGTAPYTYDAFAPVTYTLGLPNCS